MVIKLGIFCCKIVCTECFKSSLFSLIHMLFKKIWPFFHFFLAAICHRNHSFTLDFSEFKFLELIQIIAWAFPTVSISIMIFLHHLMWHVMIGARKCLFLHKYPLFGWWCTWDLNGDYFALVHIQHKRTISLWFHYCDKQIQKLHRWIVPLKKHVHINLCHSIQIQTCCLINLG